MKILITLLFVNLPYMSFGQHLDIVKFQSLPSTIEVGDSAVVSWEVHGVDSVYVSGIGKKPQKGQLTMAPNTSQILYLVAETPTLLTIDSLTLIVKGSKEVSPFPKEDAYNQNSYRKRTIRYRDIGKLLNDISLILETRKFAIKEVFDRRGYTGTLYSNYRLGPKFNYPSDTDNVDRRIAYSISVRKLFIEDKYELLLTASISFRRKAEKNWNLETEEKFYDRVLDDLHNLINSNIRND